MVLGLKEGEACDESYNMHIGILGGIAGVCTTPSYRHPHFLIFFLFTYMYITGGRSLFFYKKIKLKLLLLYYY